MYLPKAVAPDVLAANDRTELERLTAARMVHSDGSGAPTVTGLLVIGCNPRWHINAAYAQFLRIDGTDLAGPIVDAKAIDGTVEQIYRQTMVKLRSFRTVAYEILPESGERQTPSVPLVALEQLLANAIMHRSYEATNAPIRITWLNDRIELRVGTPNGFATSPAKFAQPKNRSLVVPPTARPSSSGLRQSAVGQERGQQPFFRCVFALFTHPSHPAPAFALAPGSSTVAKLRRCFAVYAAWSTGLVSSQPSHPSSKSCRASSKSSRAAVPVVAAGLAP